MTKIYPHIIPKIEKWPIYLFSQNRSGFIAEMNEHIFQKIKRRKHTFEDILASTIYHEKIRVRTNPWKVDPGNEINYWRKLESELQHSRSQADKEQLQEDILRRIINRYSEEIVGNFNPGSFRFARKFLTAFFKRLLNTAASRNYRRLWGNKHQLYERLLVQGKVEEIRSLMDKGTVVIVPTHFSNLDSILVGYAIDSIVGIPAFSYGAGLNLYDVEILAYFMNRLGAYKVDRRKKNSIYLEGLKSFSNLSIQHNVNSIFFPGGTRSRSGQLEGAVKLGLLGSLVEAQRELLLKNVDRKIYVVPLIISYHFVLEAKDLIEQHLKRTGREKYLIGKGKDTNARKILKFLWNLFSAGSEIGLNFAEPLDVFGNLVNMEGESIDERGHKIDIHDYFSLGNELTTDIQREKIYTKILGEKIVDSFHKHNLVLSSHLIAFSAFRFFLNKHKKLDFFGVLNLPASEFEVSLEKFIHWVKPIQAELIAMNKDGQIDLSPMIFNDTEVLVRDGIKQMGVYHPEKPLVINKQSILNSQNLKLLCYYHNRLLGYSLEEKY